MSATDDQPLAHQTTQPALLQSVLVAGKYRLVRRLGKGGMADVWAAEHEELRRTVAMKFVLPEWLSEPTSTSAVLERFRFEAQVSARLCERSSHVVAVYDYGTHEGTPYLVMELVSGRTLEDEIQARGHLPPAEVADILEQTAQALDTAHALGIVHRDLKPSNLLVSRTEAGALVVKVADFGVAKAFSAELRIDRPRETTAGALVGSPAFMSPEQIDNRPTLDGRSDVWALGAVAYEALTGIACFDGPTLLRVLGAVSTGRFVPLRERTPELPAALEPWLARALALDPARRFATVGEMAAAFRASLAPSPRRWSPRALALVAAALVLLSLAVVAARRFLGAELPPSANASEAPGASGHDLAPTAPPSAASPAPGAGASTSDPIVTPGATSAPSTGATAAGASTGNNASASVAAPRTTPSASPSSAVPTTSVTAAPSTPPSAPTAPRPKKWMDPSEIQ